MMPAHRMRGAPACAGRTSRAELSVPGICPPRPQSSVTSVEHIAALLDEGADDVMRNGDRRRRREPLRVLAAQHQFELLAVEPARFLDLAFVDDDLFRERLGVAA